MSPVSKFLISYNIGYALNILEYFIAAIIKHKVIHVVFALLITIGALIIVFLNRHNLRCLAGTENCDNHFKGDFFTSTIVFIYLLLNIIIYGALYKDILSIPQDLGWWMSNSVALKRGFFPDYLTMSGTSLSYHYFSSIQIAFVSNVTGINVVDLSTSLYSFTKTFVMAGAVSFMFDVFGYAGLKKAIGLILMLFSTGLEFLVGSPFFGHIMKLPMGFDIGYAFGILAFAMLYYTIKNFKEDSSWDAVMLTVLFFAICTGAKAPIAAVLLVGVGGVLLGWLLRRKYKAFLVYGTGIFGIFLFINFICVGLGKILSGESNYYYLALHSIDELSYFNGTETPFALAAVLRVLCMNPLLICMMLFSVYYFLLHYKLYGIDDKTVFAVAMGLSWLAGMILSFLIKADGSSEVYFSMASYIPGVFFVLTVHDQICERKDSRTEELNKPTAVALSLEKFACSVFGLLGIYCFFFHTYRGDGAYITGGGILKNLSVIAEFERHDFDALEWLRDNSDTNALVVSDYSVIEDDIYRYNYGIISERQQYLEGTYPLKNADRSLQEEIARRRKLIRELYSGNAEIVYELKEENVNYIVQTENVSPDFIADDSVLELVIAKNGINIYEVK